MTEKTRTIGATLTLILAVVVGAATAAVVYSFQTTYGPTTGSRVDGAVEALKGGAIGLAVVAALAVVTFVLARGSNWRRGLAVATAVLSVGALALAGGQAAVVKYDQLAKVPDCSGAPGLQAAADELDHPAPFGGGWNGITGCGAEVLNLTFDEAATAYRAELVAAGWSVVTDDSSQLIARRGDITFALGQPCGSLTLELRTAASTGPGC
jgi:hypothetical protein